MRAYLAGVPCGCTLRAYLAGAPCGRTLRVHLAGVPRGCTLRIENLMALLEVAREEVVGAGV